MNLVVGVAKIVEISGMFLSLLNSEFSNPGALA